MPTPLGGGGIKINTFTTTAWKKYLSFWLKKTILLQPKCDNLRMLETNEHLIFFFHLSRSLHFLACSFLLYQYCPKCYIISLERACVIQKLTIHFTGKWKWPGGGGHSNNSVVHMHNQRNVRKEFFSGLTRFMRIAVRG